MLFVENNGMEKTNLIQNLSKNLTRTQKIGIGIFLVLIVMLLMVVISFSNNFQRKPTQEDGETISGGNQEETVEGATWGNLMDGNDAKIQVPISTDYNEDHVYTLNNYLPKGDYNFLMGEESMQGFIEYYIIKENTAIDKGIIVSVDSCNVEENKIAANAYLKQLPVDLSDYVIVYRTHVGDVPCNTE